MTAAGLAIMIVSVGAVVSLFGYCLFRVFTLPREVVEEHLKGPLGIDTGDTTDAD